MHRVGRMWKWSASFKGAAVVAATLTFVPSALQSIDARGVASQGLSISVDRMSPAYAAFEDSRASFMDLTEAELFSSTIQGQLLQAGVKSAAALAESLLPRQPQYQDENIESSLAGMTIRQTTEPILRPSDLAAQQARPIHISGLSQPKSDQVQVQESTRPTKRDPRHQRIVDQYRAQQWATPTLAQKAKELVDQELERRAEERVQGRVIPSSRTGSPGIYVGRPSPPQQPAASPAKPKNNARATQQVASNDSTNTGSVGIMPTGDQGDSNWYPSPLDPERLRPMTYAGHLQMTEGLAFIGSESILTVSRVYDGVVKETGQVWVTDARFEIFVEEAVGYLVAELRTPEGDLLGQGELDLYSLSKPAANQVKVDSLLVKLKPAQSGMNITVVSAYSYKNNQEVISQATVEIEALGRELPEVEQGRFADKLVNPSSSYILRAQAENHWGSLSVALSETDQQVRMFSNSMMKALLDLTLEDPAGRQEAQQMAVIWGKVSKDGRPVAGAEVELAGDPLAHLVYFNSYFLPDKTLKSTSENGLFAYVSLTPGIHSVRAKFNGQLFPAQVTPTQGHHVSYVNVEMGPPRSVNVKVYDALDPHVSVPASVSIVGSEHEFEVQGESLMKYSTGEGLMMVEAMGSDDYEIIRLDVSRKARSLHLPMVRREWLTSLAVSKMVNLEPDSGIIVGFIRGSHYTVELDQSQEYPTHNIVYFDHDGRMIRGDSGVPGGGFAIFNVPPGYRTVFVTTPKGHRYLSQVLVGEPGIVNVMSRTLKSDD